MADMLDEMAINVGFTLHNNAIFNFVSHKKIMLLVLTNVQTALLLPKTRSQDKPHSI